MGDDVDMEAPQISTLKEEATPPPSLSAATSTPSKLRVKLVVSRSKGTSSPKTAVPAKRPRSDDDGEDDDDDQEDQLIDDDDDGAPASASAPVKPTEPQAPAPKRKPPVKRKSKKNETADVPAPESTAFDPNHISLTVAVSDSISAPPPPKKKKANPPKAAASVTAPRVVKTRTPKLKTVLSQLADDSGALSEGFTATAASSPATMHSPDPDMAPSEANFEGEEEKIDLSTVAVPIYPLPTKPFPVQQAPKLPVGYATARPPELSNREPVRKWHVARREIRGIAGGRWLARSWVGDKNSQFAGNKLAAAEASLAIPKLPTLLSAKGKGKAASKSAGATALSSRSQSVATDGIPPVRNLTKMRTTMQFPIAPSSEAGDSDMMG